MKRIIYLLALTAFTSAPAQADDNIAACEVVVQQPIAPDSDGVNYPSIATFIPAAGFIFSVFDAEPGHMTSIKDKPIKALMCTRSNVVPTEFDLKLIRTDIPLYLSQNFDSPDSALLR